jgi:hypothetical protein
MAVLRRWKQFGEQQVKISVKTNFNTDSLNKESHFEGYLSTDIDLLRREVTIANYGEKNHLLEHEYKGRELLGLDFSF